MRCFFSENLGEPGDQVLPDAQELHHIFTTLRAKAGDKIFFVDGKGKIAEAGVDKDRKILIDSVRETPPPLPLLHLFISPPRMHQKMDSLLSQCAELGVHSLTPLICRNSVSKPEAPPSKWVQRLKEGCKQSHNPYLTAIKPVMTLAAAVSEAAENHIDSYFGSLTGKTGLSGVGTPCAWFVGPEGGFTTEEERLMSESGIKALKIGDCIMRTETAAVAGIAILINQHKVKGV